VRRDSGGVGGVGPWWGVLITVALIPVLLWRLFDEEALLARDLPGYVAYQNTVRWRLVPFLW
jgi:protein-S-isoprenylcysteine O-methyltransferase Ste14